MGRKSKVSNEDKILSVRKYLNNEISIANIADKYSLNVSSVKGWITKY